MRRRTVIVGAAGLVGLAASRRFALAASAGRKPTSHLETFLRIRCSPQGQRTYWWYSGHVLARTPVRPAVPMLSVVGVSYSELRVRDQGVYQYDLAEAGYYGDPDSGEIKDQVTNPLTGKTINPQHYLSSQSLLFHPDLTVTPNLANPRPGLEFRGRITPPDVKHGRIWMAEELFVRVVRAEDDIFIANSLANFEAGVADVNDAGKAFVPASMEYTTINSFRPWMGMDDTAGTVSMRLNGFKLQDTGGIPEDLLARVKGDHPAFL